MKLAVSNIGWDIKKNEKVYDLMKQYGYNGLEIAPTKFFNDPYFAETSKIIDLKKSIENRGLKLVSMQSILYGKNELKVFQSDEIRFQLKEYLKKAIDFAEKLGVNTLVFGSPRNRVINNYKKEYKIAIDLFRELGEYAHLHNTNLCIEPNPKEYNTNFINTTKDAIELVKNVDSLGFKVNLDLSTVILNNETLDIIDNNINFINHVHISEPFLEPINKKNLNLHNKLISILNSNGYSNWVSIEMKQIDDLNKIEEILRYIAEISKQ